MPKRNYSIFDWKEREKISDHLDDVDHDAQIHVLALTENSDGGGKYILEITDNKNLDNPVLFEVVINVEGRITNFQACPDIRTYPDIKIEVSQYTKEVKTIIASVMGNDIGETMYTIHLRHKRYVSKAVEFEVAVHPTEQISYIQEPPNRPLMITDEDDN